MKCAIFSCLGLGDGLIILTLANNLHLNGHEVVTFHPSLSGLQNWFPYLPIQPFPPLDVLKEYDRFFVVYEKSSWMQEVLAYCKAHFPEKTTVINPIATLRHDYPYWEEARFEGNRCMIDNLYFFCRDVLKLKEVTKDNGIRRPHGVTSCLYPKRIIIHPTSSREGKNWPKNKYLKLTQKLRSRSYYPIFVVSPQEQAEWPEAISFETLHDLAVFVSESGAMIGNDSGIGHLASNLGLPTLIICRNHQVAQFWRPGWAPGQVVTPPRWLPNLKGLRWRDRHWQKAVSVGKVFRASINMAFNI